MRKILLAALLGTAAPLPAYAVSDSGYSLTLSGGFEAGGYVRMRDGEVYQICLSSSRSERTDVALSVDGLSVGEFRLAPYSSFCLEGPLHDSGRFTFYKSDRQGGVLSGSNQVARDDRGRIAAQFIPEYVPPPPPPPPPPVYVPAPAGGGLSSGVTGLTEGPEVVRRLQQALQERGFYQGPLDGDYASGVTGLTGQSGVTRYQQSAGEGTGGGYQGPLDGVYGSATTAAVTRYQQSAGEGTGGLSDLSSGVTGLTGRSEQALARQAEIQRDWSAAVTLELRLVHDQALEPPPQLYVVPPPATYSPSGAPTIYHGHPPPPTYYSLPPPANPRPLPGRMIPAPPPVRDY